MPMRIVAVLAVLAPSARADPPAPVPVHVGFGGGGSLGIAQEHGRETGWVARIDYQFLPTLVVPDQVGPVLGFAPSLQVWRAGEDWGIGVPFAFHIGARTPRLRAVAELGVEAVFVDRVDDDTGLGLYAPMAGVSVLSEARGWYAGAGARITRRWQIGAGDHTQWQAVITIGRTWEARMREPMR